jgi:hypothetical protein
LSIIQFRSMYQPILSHGFEFRARIFKLLWSPGNDSKEPIQPAYVAWGASTITLFLIGS